MSSFYVEKVRVQFVKKHENADNLEIAIALNHPVVVRKGQFKKGDEAIYISVDAILPDIPQFSFLSEGDRSCLRAKKLRGVYSQGLLVKPWCTCGAKWVESCDDNCLMLLDVGADVRNIIGITKWEPQLDLRTGGDNVKDPGFIPVYTDLESLRRYDDILEEGEEVVLTEKTHGANGRFLYKDECFWIGSHRCIKKESETSIWWVAAKRAGLFDKLPFIPDMILYGEVFGANVQDMDYDRKQLDIVAFDIFDIKTGTYLDVDSFQKVCKDIGVPIAPVLYRGPWNKELLSLANGPTIVGNGKHTREGFVVRPVKERWNEQIGRVILKMVGENYLMRKKKK